MRSTAGLVAVALLMGLLGALCLAVSRLERDIAHAEQAIVGSNFEEADEGLERAERALDRGSWLPGVAEGPLNDVRARRAALRYWRGEYAGLVPEGADPVGSVPPAHIALQLVTANAVYRTGQTLAKDRQSTLNALEAGILGYQTVLKNSDRNENAAYNYEYLVRLREELLKGRRKPGFTVTELNNPNGRGGEPPDEDPGADEFKIYVPLQTDEREKPGARPGTTAPLQRKG
jgi:hypothetical protein